MGKGGLSRMFKGASAENFMGKGGLSRMYKGGSEGVAFAWDFARPLGFPPVAFAWVHGRMCCLAVVLSVG